MGVMNSIYSIEKIRILSFYLLGSMLSFNYIGVIYLYEVFTAIYFIIYVYSFRRIPDNLQVLSIITILIVVRILISVDPWSQESVTWIGTYGLLFLAVAGLYALSRGSWEYCLLAVAGIQLGAAADILLFGNDILWYARESFVVRLAGVAPIPLFYLSIFMFAEYRQASRLLLLTCVLLSLFNLDRGGALLYLVVFGTTYLSRFKGRNKKTRRIDYLLFFVLGIGFALLMSELLVWAAEMKLFSERFNVRIVQQSSHQYGMLFGARPDTVAMIRAIADSPIVGYGADGPPWAMSREMMGENLNLSNLGRAAYDRMYERGLVLHSGLLGAWVRFGIVGGMFWLTIMGFSVVAIRKFMFVSNRYSLLVNYLNRYIPSCEGKEFCKLMVSPHPSLYD